MDTKNKIYYVYIKSNMSTKLNKLLYIFINRLSSYYETLDIVEYVNK